jgi:hypothetical protein
MSEPSTQADWIAIVDVIISELPDLLAAPDAAAVADALTPLTARLRQDECDTEAVADEVVTVLAEHRNTRDRLNDLLGRESVVDRYPRPAGDALIAYDRWVCVECKRAWIVLDADEDERPPTNCPDDGAPLTFTAGG